MSNYNHAEAFRWMTYSTKHGSCISIWNSRDGVTPFTTSIDNEMVNICDEYDKQYRMANHTSNSRTEDIFKTIEEIEKSHMVPDYVWIGEPSEPKKIPWIDYVLSLADDKPSNDSVLDAQKMMQIQAQMKSNEEEELIQETLKSIDITKIALFMRQNGYTCLKKSKKKRRS